MIYKGECCFNQIGGSSPSQHSNLQSKHSDMSAMPMNRAMTINTNHCHQWKGVFRWVQILYVLLTLQIQLLFCILSMIDYFIPDLIDYSHSQKNCTSNLPTYEYIWIYNTWISSHDSIIHHKYIIEWCSYVQYGHLLRLLHTVEQK